MATARLDQVLHRLRFNVIRHGDAQATDGELLACYVATRDEAAFEALLRRHGAMVFGVCRRVLQNDADAEDAFQATFLVLVRKAASLRQPGGVSNWLYGVAHNTALKAKAMIQQRRAKEKVAGAMPKGTNGVDSWPQLQSVVDAELNQLPEKYRMPIVLCDLEGKTIKEAVHQLGWPQGTLASRLTRGRALLAKRLTKHGITLSAGAVAAALTQGAASAAVPASLTATTVHAAGLFAAGKTAAASGVSATAAVLTEGVLRTMLLMKLKLAATLLILASALSVGIGGFAYRLLAADDVQPAATPKAVPPRPGIPQPKPNRQAQLELEKARAEVEVARANLALAEAQLKIAQANLDAVRSIAGKPDLRGKLYLHRGLDLAGYDLLGRNFVDLKPLTKDHRFNYQALSARLSPDGALLAFGQANMGTPPSKIQVRNLHKEDAPKVLVDMAGKELSSWSWSPDGKMLSFAVWGEQPGKYTPYVVDVASGKAQKVVLPVLKGKGPEGFGTLIHAWSPDGLWLVFARGHFFIVHPQTKDARQLNAEPIGFLAGSCRFSPDGKKLLYVGGGKEDERRLTVLDLLVGKTTTLADLTGKWDISACWSPDARQVICASVPVNKQYKRQGPCRVEAFHADGQGQPALVLEDAQAWYVVTDWRAGAAGIDFWAPAMRQPMPLPAVLPASRLPAFVPNVPPAVAPAPAQPLPEDPLSTPPQAPLPAPAPRTEPAPPVNPNP